jgi:hypothetical protein
MEIKIFDKEDVYDFSESSIREDLDRIKNVCQKMNIYLSDDEAYLAYHNWSEDYYCAGWLCLPDSDLDLYVIMKDVIDYFIYMYARIDYYEK